MKNGNQLHLLDKYSAIRNDVNIIFTFVFLNIRSAFLFLIIVS